MTIKEIREQYPHIIEKAEEYAHTSLELKTPFDTHVNDYLEGMVAGLNMLLDTFFGEEN